MIGFMIAAQLAAVTAATDTATTSYEVHGIQVIHRPLAANEIVAVNLYLLGGSRQLDATTAGIEPLLLRSAEFGTERYPGREARLALAHTGSYISMYTAPDWTMFGFRGLRTEFDSTWNVWADRVMAPAFDSAGIQVVRNRMLRAVRSARSHPDGLVFALADSIAFAGHPYQHDPGGTEASLTTITTDMMRTYFTNSTVRSRMTLVVVGNITRSQIEAAIERTFALLPAGNYVWTLPPEWKAESGSILTHERRLPTNYIVGYFSGPRSDDPDYVRFRIATMLLGGISGYEIREAGLSYAASSPFLDMGASGGGIYVTTVDPDEALRIFNNNIELLRNASISRSALRRYFEGFITNYYSENESNAGQADFLARYQLLQGDWRRSSEYMRELRDVQGYQVRHMAREYMRNIRYVYVGNPTNLPEKEMKRFQN